MYYIHLRGEEKPVYMVWSNIAGYGLPDITETKTENGKFIMCCEIATKWDAVPNQHRTDEEWDGTKADLSSYGLEAAKEGRYADEYSDHELRVLSGMFDVDIEVYNDPEDKFWEYMDNDDIRPSYLMLRYSEGVEKSDHYEEYNDNNFSF